MTGIEMVPLATEVFGELRIPATLAMTQELEAIAQRATELARQSRAANTLRAYRSSWKQYALWCARFGFEPLGADPQVVALHIAAIADRLAPATIRLRLSAIVAAHRLLDLQLDPKHRVIAAVTGGAMRQTGRPGKRLATPVQSAALRKIAEACPSDAVGVRDRAMILLGFGAACRRSELVALDIADVVADERGAAVTFVRSKTDQEGQGAVVAIHGSDDPALDIRAALAAWLTIRRRHMETDENGQKTERERRGRVPLFCQLSKTGRPLGRKLSDYAVVRMIKGAASRAGLDPTGYSGHSLRSGLATTAAGAGATLAEVMDQGRWRSVEMAKHYVRDAEIWRNAASRAMNAGERVEPAPSKAAAPTPPPAPPLDADAVLEENQPKVAVEEVAMPKSSETGVGPALPFEVRVSHPKPFNETETGGHLRRSEEAVEAILAGRRSLSPAERTVLRREFRNAFLAVRAACDKGFFRDYGTRNIMMGVSFEAAGIFVRAKKDINLDAMLADLRFIPTAIEMDLDLPRGDEVPRALRAARLCWEESIHLGKAAFQRTREYLSGAQVGVVRNLR